jgi:histidinol-phosphate aminotransferase
MNPGGDFQNLIRPHLLNMKPYGYIAPIEVLAEDGGIPADRLIKLDGNENPYGCSPRVRKALSEYPYYHIYPDSEQRELRKAVQEYAGAPVDQIVVGSGSDELIDFVMRLFINPGDRVINCVPTFGVYHFSTESYGGQVVTVPRDGAFAVDLPAVKNAARAGAKVVFIASPNNPSGNTTSVQDILEVLGNEIIVVVDEAYYEFCGQTVVPLVSGHPNLIVLRTFSKWAGLAGLRVGYGILPREFAEHLFRVKPPYNVNAAAQIAAMESLKDLDYLRQTIRAIVSERQRLTEALAQTGLLRPWPSQANFILCSVLKGQASNIHRELRQRGILVRYFDTPLLKDCLRISVGKPEHTDALVAALSGIC